jgi:hypothetical protein
MAGLRSLLTGTSTSSLQVGLGLLFLQLGLGPCPAANSDCTVYSHCGRVGTVLATHKRVGVRPAVRARAEAARLRRVLGTPAGARGSWEPRHEAQTSVCNDTSFEQVPLAATPSCEHLHLWKYPLPVALQWPLKWPPVATSGVLGPYCMCRKLSLATRSVKALQVFRKTCKDFQYIESL